MLRFVDVLCAVAEGSSHDGTCGRRLGHAGPFPAASRSVPGEGDEQGGHTGTAAKRAGQVPAHPRQVPRHANAADATAAAAQGARDSLVDIAASHMPPSSHRNDIGRRRCTMFGTERGDQPRHRTKTASESSLTLNPVQRFLNSAQLGLKYNQTGFNSEPSLGIFRTAFYSDMVAGPNPSLNYH